MHNRFDIEDLASPSPLNADRLFGQVAQHLGRAIVAGTYGAGDLLPNEDGLRAELSVSRTAYREAIKVLTAKGLVEARPKSGTRVTPRENWNLLDPDVLLWQLSMNPSEATIRELFELRRIIEPRAAALAAQRRSTEELAAITAALDDMLSAPAYSEAAIRADVEFHRLIFAAAGNRPLACLAHVVVATIQWSMLVQSSRSTSISFDGPARDHRRVRDAIAERQPEMAASMMDVLIIEALGNTLNELGRRPKAVAEV
jgi:GntR family transcriptional regulator, galactonate operon transcriptional repressor